jgi:hypothetical protein
MHRRNDDVAAIKRPLGATARLPARARTEADRASLRNMVFSFCLSAMICAALKHLPGSWFLARSRVERGNRGQYFVIRKTIPVSYSPSALRLPSAQTCVEPEQAVAR